MTFAHSHSGTASIHIGLKIKFKGSYRCLRIISTTALFEESRLKGSTVKIVHGLIAPKIFLLICFFFVRSLIASNVLFFIIGDVKSYKQGQDFLSRNTACTRLPFLFRWHGESERPGRMKHFSNRKTGHVIRGGGPIPFVPSILLEKKRGGGSPLPPP